jgi:hydroxymethylpyrimidine/phosphomethylpyrimidine kinase
LNKNGQKSMPADNDRAADTENQFYPVALTIAGSDSGGGAGIQADLRTFAAFGVFGCSAVTAVTAQNPREVRGITPVPARAVLDQLEAVTAAFTVRAVKTGMLFDAAAIKVIAPVLRGLNIPLVVDPVMVSSSGCRLLKEDAIAVLKAELLPLADWVTPNRHEAEILTGQKIGGSPEAMAAAAAAIARQWDCGCILKAGHFPASDDGKSTDLAAYRDQVYRLSSPWVEAEPAAHGTGCTFSAALAAEFALGSGWQDALKAAKSFVYGSLLDAVSVGPDLEAMYPPFKDYYAKVSWQKII